MTYAPIPDFTGGTELTAAQLNILVDAINAMFPVGFYGMIATSATTTENLINGVWLECNGVAVSRSTYPDLNTLLSGVSYPFGSGNGSTTFNLPDFRGRNYIHHATSSGATDVKTLGLSDGGALASRTQKPNASISVSISGTTGSESGHTHSVSGTTGIPSTNTTTPTGSFGCGDSVHTHNFSVTSGAGSSHSHSFSGSGSGSGSVVGGFLVGGIIVVKAFS